VDEIVRFSRKEFEAAPGGAPPLAQLNTRWNRNVLLMGDFNDEPWDRSVVEYLAAGKDEDRIEQALTANDGQLKNYIGTRPFLFNYMWPVAAEPDRGTHFFSSSGNPNTMNVLDQFAASRGLHFGLSGLRIDRSSVKIFTDGGVATAGKKRPKGFDRATRTGFSDHFPITCLINVL
jgi:endonuclease/exonuclease/phosphatase family metal-dependent hydrolase